MKTIKVDFTMPFAENELMIFDGWLPDANSGALTEIEYNSNVKIFIVPNKSLWRSLFRSQTKPGHEVRITSLEARVSISDASEATVEYAVSSDEHRKSLGDKARDDFK